MLRIPEPKTFNDSFKPLIYFNWFIGMGAFRQPDKSGASSYKYYLMRIHTVVFTLSTWIMTYVTLNSVAELINFDNTSPMALTMYRTIIRANSAITAIAPFLIWLRRKGLKDCLRKMAILDDTFQGVFGARKGYRNEYIRLIWQVVTISSLTIFIGVFDIPWIMSGKRSVLKNFAIVVTVHRPIAVMLALDCSFCAALRYLGKKFHGMNECLLKSTGEPSTSSRRKRPSIVPQNVVKDKFHLLREIRKAHLELCKLSRKINLAFGIQNLLSIGMSFVMIIGLLYTIYNAFEEDSTNKRLKELIPSVMWSLIYIFRIIIVNHSCWCVSNEARKTGEVIYEFLDPRVDEELQEEINGFGVQMLQNPVRFNACGFFTLDYTFIHGAIGSTTTYLVILIQMSHLSESPGTSDTVLAWNRNGTEMSAIE